MLPCSVRRVIATAPQSPLIFSLPRAAAPRSYYISCQRRRYSSSKPSRNNGSEDPPVRQSVQPAADAKTGDAKASGEKRKRKTKDASDKLKYPSVPTTAHIPSDVLALSSFFSLHRPISVTRGLPRNVTEGAFASIFLSPPHGAKVSEVLSTLSRTVGDLEQPLGRLSLQQQQQQQQQQHQETIAATAAAMDAEMDAHNERLRKLEARSNDGSAASITGQVNSMVGQFVPFRPPPTPQDDASAGLKRTAGAAVRKLATTDNPHDQHLALAAEEEEGLGTSAMAVVAEPAVRTRVYKAVFTIEETTDVNGDVKIVAHSPAMIEDTQGSTPGSFDGSPTATMVLSVERVGDTAAHRVAGNKPQPFLSRMNARQVRFYESQTRLDRWAGLWYMISVKRQRKLKMKKKKYKKLTRRLRHDRLKLGRT